jgi:tetratricopeptide (TPR) repeat protein
MAMKAARVLACLALLALAVSAGAQDAATALYNAGNAAYASGDYAAAIAKYEQARATGAVNHALFHNLGNAYFKAGQVGRAILNYERGARLAPGDDDLRFNLRFALARTVDKVDAPEEGFLGGLLRRAAERISVAAAVGVAVALYLLICTAVLLAVLFRRSATVRTWALLTGAGLLVVFLLYSPLLYAKASGDAAMEGVVVAAKVDVTSGPGQDFTTVFTVHEGTRVTVREVRDRWAQVTIPSGFSGWIPRDAYEPI